MDAQPGSNDPPTPGNANGALGGAAHRTRIEETTTAPTGDVNSEIDRLLRQWLRTGEDFPRRLAHVLRDAAKKQHGI